MTLAFPVIPALPLLNLPDDQRRLIGALQQKMSNDVKLFDLRDAYYDGEQVVTDLGIAIPPQLRGLHTVLGWPQLAVDAVHERLDVEGFRFLDSDDADDDMWAIWQANNLDEEGPLAHLDALIAGRSYVVVGTAETEFPLMTVESPRNMSGRWNSRTRRVREALQVYDDEGEQEAALYLPDETITLHRSRNQWEIAERDRHNLGMVPVLRMANRQRTHDRSGWSEITEPVMSVTDAGCRTLLGLEVAREFYGSPQRFVLGVSEEAFQDSAGNTKTAWETYIGRILALERDEEGNLPQVGQFQPYNPAVYADIINMYADIMASITGLPASYLGKSTDNPASADAIRMSTDRLVQRAKRRQRSYEGAWEAAMRLALAFRTGTVPDLATQIETIWRNPEIPTPGATTDAVTKQIQAGYLPPESDVAGEKLGYTPLQRRRIEKERRRQQGADALSAVLNRAQTETAGEPSEPAPV
ncbi:MAG: phage portal protein [Actinobacteria bacterium]|nr:phage portal protein [Actinomycetota bacterium]